MQTKQMVRFLKAILRSGVEKGAIPPGMEEVQLLPIVRGQVAKRIREKGVASVRLNLGQYMETVRAEADEVGKSPLPRMANAIAEQFEGSLSREQIVESANLSVRLEIRVDKRFKRFGSLRPIDLADFGESITAEAAFDEDVVIETADGSKIRHGELALTKSVQVRPFAQTVQHEDAWEKMAEYMRELRADRLLGAMTRNLAWGRLALFAIGIWVIVGLLAVGPLPMAASASALNVLATVLSILAGFLIAVITMMGDPSGLLEGNWRIASVHRREIRRSLNRFSGLFYLYLAVIGATFVASLVEEAVPEPAHRWVEHAALCLGAGALVFSFGLPAAIRREQLRRLDEEVERRRSESHEQDAGGTDP